MLHTSFDMHVSSSSYDMHVSSSSYDMHRTLFRLAESEGGREGREGGRERRSEGVVTAVMLVVVDASACALALRQVCM